MYSVCVYTGVYVFWCVCVYILVCVHVCWCVCVYWCVCVCVLVCVFISKIRMCFLLLYSRTSTQLLLKKCRLVHEKMWKQSCLRSLKCRIFLASLAGAEIYYHHPT